MSLTEKKIAAWTNPVSAEADRPERSAADMKAIFDSNSNQLKAALNSAIDELVSPAGAGQIGLGPVEGIQAATVQEGFSALKTYADDLAIGSGDMVSVNGMTGRDIWLDYEDVGAAAPADTLTVTLTAADWAGEMEPYTQTVAAQGVTADAVVDVSAAPESFLAYCAAQVRAVAQGENNLTFACEDVPEGDLTVNVKILH